MSKVVSLTEYAKARGRLPARRVRHDVVVVQVHVPNPVLLYVPVFLFFMSMWFAPFLGARRAS